MMSRSRSIAALLFFSGGCALVYQVAWLRELRLVFGASTPANAAVLAVFMGGLGYGSLALSRRVELTQNALDLYARFELGIAIAAAISPLLLDIVRRAYIATGGVVALGHGGATLARLLLSAVVLLPPTLLMGGTLPAAAKAATDEADEGRRTTALLYGANAIGAVLGATLSTFVMLEVFGIRLTLWIGCAINLLVAVVARAMARRLAEAAAPRAPENADEPEEEDADEPEEEDADENVPPKIPPRPALSPRPFVLAAAGATGFVFLLLELTWYRMLSPLLGGSTYTFGLILALALLGIGLGGLLYTLRSNHAPTLAAFAVTCALEAVFIAVPFALGDRIAVLAIVLRGLSVTGLFGQALGWTAITGLVVFPAATVAGYQFPLLIALLGRGRRSVGRDVGLAYATNTLGSILGSLIGGFFAFPLWTARGTWRLTVFALTAMGVAALVLGRGTARRAWGSALALSVLAPLLVILPQGPTEAWQHSPIGAGRADGVTHRATRNELKRWRLTQRAGVSWQIDGRESSIALHQLHDTAFLVNGKSDGSAVGDAGTQVMSGLLGALLHSSGPKRVLVIGLGTGSTAGWLASLEGVEHVDVVEIEPLMTNVARACHPVNQAVMDNPKIHLHINDAREVLLTQGQSYDLVFSEPSNPYRAGIASLFTHEFYEALKQRLAPNAVFVQWVQGYEIDVHSVRTVFTTLAQTFSYVELWQGKVNDMLLVARSAEHRYQADALRTRMQTPSMRDGLLYAWRTDQLEGVLARFVASSALVAEVAASSGESLINTDDRNLLEFGVARTVGRPQRFSVAELQALSRKRGWARPPIDGPVDWARVVDLQLQMNLAPSGAPSVVGVNSDAPGHRFRRDAFQAWVAGNFPIVVRAWQAQEQKPDSPVEYMVLAEAYANLGDAERAEPLLRQLAKRLPDEAAAIRARLLFQQKDVDGAAAATQAALVAHRNNPWSSAAVLRRTVALAYEIAQANPKHIPGLVDALAQPFSVHLVDRVRTDVRFRIALMAPDPALCVAALKSYEPFPDWERDFLEKRVACYRDAGDPHLAQAEADLLEYYDNEGQTVAKHLVP